MDDRLGSALGSEVSLQFFPDVRGCNPDNVVLAGIVIGVPAENRMTNFLLVDLRGGFPHGVFADVDQKLSQPRGLLELAAPRYTVYQRSAFFQSERMRTKRPWSALTWAWHANRFYRKAYPLFCLGYEQDSICWYESQVSAFSARWIEIVDLYGAEIPLFTAKSLAPHFLPPDNNEQHAFHTGCFCIRAGDLVCG